MHDLKCDNYTYAIIALYLGVYKTSVSDAARDKSEIYPFNNFCFKTMFAKFNHKVTIDYYVKKRVLIFSKFYITYIIF